MITLHTANTPNGKKISIALEELGLKYAVERVDLQAAVHPTPEFLDLNPNHKIPVIEDKGHVIWESGAILLYLGETYDDGGIILPNEPSARLQAIQYAFFQTGGVGPNLGRFASAMRKEGEKNHEMLEIFGGEMDRLMGVLDRILDDGRDFLAGAAYSIGDIMHYPWLYLAQKGGLPWILERPRLVQWLDRVGQRPAVQRGMKVPE